MLVDELLDDRAEGDGGEEHERPDEEDDADETGRRTARESVLKVPADSGTTFFCGEHAAEGERRHHLGEAPELEGR